MKPILYRPGSKAPVITAFTLAAAIHLSALAFATNHPPPANRPDGGFTIIEIFDPPSPEPEPEPELSQPVETVTQPQIEWPTEFFDAAEPTPQPLYKSNRALRPRRVTPARRNAGGNGKLFAINAPRPAYPYEARRRRVTGSGVAILDVNSGNGLVIAARIVESTGNPILDNSALSAFKRWRFRIGSPSTVKIPFTFTMHGVQL